MKRYFDIINVLILTSIITLILTSILSQANAADWGATPLLEKFRPERAWIDKFSITPDVIATGLIADAIDSCDNIVGVGKHCVVEVSNSVSGFPLYITRSKTKLVGTKGMNPLSSNNNVIFIYIGDNVQKVIISGLNLHGHSAGNDEIHGIIVWGKNINHIMINDNKIHDFHSKNNAHGIAVYGTGKNNQESVQNVIIEGNQVYSMETGSSESISVNGNVKLWEIKNNNVSNVNNIAIDAIGGEGVSPTGTDSIGRIVPGKFDTARYGFIESNFIENMSTLNNPIYGNKESWAGAIYIDGGHHIKITNNVVVNTPWSYDIGAENCLVSQHISLTGNSATGSTFGDLLLGGYAETGYLDDNNINCNPNNTVDANEGHGYVSHLTVKNNLFNSTNSQSAPITLQFRIRHTLIVEPNVVPENEDGNGSASGDANAIRTVE